MFGGLFRIAIFVDLWVKVNHVFFGKLCFSLLFGCCFLPFSPNPIDSCLAFAYLCGNKTIINC